MCIHTGDLRMSLRTCSWAWQDSKVTPQPPLHASPGLTSALLTWGLQAVVLTASELEEQLKVGALCHKLGICFLVADTWGLVG